MPDLNEGDNSTDVKGGNLVSPNDNFLQTIDSMTSQETGIDKIH